MDLVIIISMLPALHSLIMFDMLYDIEEVKMSIFQPRRENVGTWTMAADELRAWGETVLKQKALLAIDGKGECNPGEWCTFCRAAVKCRARAEQHMVRTINKVLLGRCDKVWVFGETISSGMFIIKEAYIFLTGIKV